MEKIIILIKSWVIIGSFVLPTVAFGQLNSYSFEALNTLQQDHPKNVIVYIHTDWCRYCKAMENTTLKDKKVVSKLNENFYFIDLNAEEQRDIHFSGRFFKYRPSGVNTGTNELATALAEKDGQVSYPTLVILNADNEILFQLDGFTNIDDMVKVLDVLEKYNPSTQID